MATLRFLQTMVIAGESARNELSHLKSVWFAFKLLKYLKTFINREMETPKFEHGRVYFKQIVAERANVIKPLLVWKYC